MKYYSSCFVAKDSSLRSRFGGVGNSQSGIGVLSASKDSIGGLSENYIDISSESKQEVYHEHMAEIVPLRRE